MNTARRVNNRSQDKVRCAKILGIRAKARKQSVADMVAGSNCPTCCHPAAAPYRAYDARGKVSSGCVDAWHEGQYLVGESAAHHASPGAQAIRKNMCEYLSAL